MPGPLLHFGATVQCPHFGQAMPTVVCARVKVSGQPVAVQVPDTIAGCTLPPPPAGNGPCVSAQWVTAATRVKANGLPVRLFDSRALCAPTGVPLVVAMLQQRVKGM